MPELEHGHDPQEIADRLSVGPVPNYLRDWVYGGIDGAVTTFAIVAGIAGAGLSTTVILILGAANLIADGFSMAAANYSGTKAEADDRDRLRQQEYRHIRVAPEGEVEEIRQIFAAKGFAGEDLERAVAVTTASRDRWVDLMLAEEYGVPRSLRSAWTAAIVTFAAFIICGGIPLLPFLFSQMNSFAISIGMTAAVFFGIGSLKGRWSTAPWWRSGLETVSIGMTAAALAYTVGALLKAII